EPPQAAFAGLPEVLRSPIGLPAARPGPDQPPLRRDDQVLWGGEQCPGDQALADVWAVSVRGIDERDIKLHGPPQSRLGHIQVGRVAPDAWPRDPHRAETKPV